MKGDSDIQSDFISLPSELRMTIFEMLVPDDRFCVRHTCRTFCSDIDKYVGIKANINAELEKDLLEFLSNISIREATVGSMQNIVFDDVFLFPLYLKTCRITGRNYANFIEDLLQSCHNLNSLTLGGVIKNRIFGELPYSNNAVSQLLKFSKLKVLDIRMAKGVFTNTAQLCVDNSLTILRNLYSPMLSQFRFDSWITTESSVSLMTCALIHFLFLHKNLKSILIILRLHESADDLNESFNQDDAEVGNNKEQKFKHELEQAQRKEYEDKLKVFAKRMKLRSMGLLVDMWDPFWETLMESQDHLQAFSFCNANTNWTILQSILSKNWSTLRKVSIITKFPARLNFTVLSKLVYIRELLVCNTDLQLPIFDPNDQVPAIENIDVLTVLPLLEFLAIENLIFRTEDIHKLTKLKMKHLSLTCAESGLEGEGMDINCMQNLLHMRTLDAILLRLNWASNTDMETYLKTYEIASYFGIDENENVEDKFLNIHPSDFSRWHRTGDHFYCQISL